jgi:ribosomal protein S6--L-glutamate ligase
MTSTRQILVMNGEPDWAAHFPDAVVTPMRLQDCSWVLRDQKLVVIDRQGSFTPDAILWRVGAVRLQPRHRIALELIRLAGVPCVNPARTILRTFDRLSGLAEMREIGLPTVSTHVALGEGMALHTGRPAPFVVKAGNHHAGYGKARVESDQAWPELADLLFAVDDYVATEPFIDYARDIRCLVVGDRVWAMSRQSDTWKANVGTKKAQVIEPPAAIEEMSRRAAAHLQADILGLDFLETQSGDFVLLEANDTPGLSGFPEETREALAAIVRAHLAR